MKILQSFGENRLEFVEKLKIIMIGQMISIWNVKKFVKFFDQNLYEKFTFVANFY